VFISKATMEKPRAVSRARAIHSCDLSPRHVELLVLHAIFKLGVSARMPAHARIAVCSINFECISLRLSWRSPMLTVLATQ